MPGGKTRPNQPPVRTKKTARNPPEPSMDHRSPGKLDQGSRKRRKKIKRVIIDPRPRKPPWTDEQLDAIIERAILYIEEAKRRWGFKLGLTVGEWLYRELYGMNDEYLRSRDPGKTRSLYDIAQRTGLSARTLRTWVWAARMKIRLEADGFRSDALMLTDWAALYPLRDHPLAARQVAEWVHRDNPTIEEVVEHVRRWKRFKSLPPKPRPRPEPNRRRRRRPFEQRVLRVMRLVHRWVHEVELSRPLRERLLAQVREIRALVESGGRA